MARGHGPCEAADRVQVRPGSLVPPPAAELLGGHVGGRAGHHRIGDRVAVDGLSEAEIDVLFVGTGDEIAHAPPEFRRKVEELGIGVEVMASPAACRTYNVLLSEGRRIGAALLPVIEHYSALAMARRSNGRM